MQRVSTVGVKDDVGGHFFEMSCVLVKRSVTFVNLKYNVLPLEGKIAGIVFTQSANIEASHLFSA